MSSVVVTGGLGKVGQWLIDGMADEGHDVVGVDLDHPGFSAQHARRNVSFRAGNLTDRGTVLDIFESVAPDLVLHFGAIPTMGRNAPGDVFENNVVSTYNVLKAAGRTGADIVQASTESVYGIAFAEEPWLPEYLPVDEDHPKRPEDEYGTGKLIAEEVAKMVVRRHDVSAVSLRPTWINYPGSYACLGLQDDISAGANGLWGYLDIRDLVSLVEVAADADVDGHEAVQASAENTYLDRPTTEAVSEYFGALPETCGISGRASAFSTGKARALFGWDPEHRWETAADESVDGPGFLDA
jgi:nucleoside-diphosphate-sugar epimerase